MSDKSKAKNLQPAPAPATVAAAPATETPMARALAAVAAAKAAAKDALKTARKEAAAIDPDYDGPNTGMLIRVLSTEHAAIKAAAGRQNATVQAWAREMLVRASAVST